MLRRERQQDGGGNASLTFLAIIKLLEIVTTAVLAGLLAACTTNVAARDTAEARNQAVDRYLKVVPVSTVLTEMSTKLATTLPPAQSDYFLAAVRDKDVQAALSVKLREVMTKVFTAEEINALASFYASPVGGSVMKKLPEFSSEIIPSLADAMQTIRAKGKLNSPPPAIGVGK